MCVKNLQFNKAVTKTFIFFLCINSAFAQNVPDIDSLGNVWIITIDKSGSMLNDKNGNRTTPKILSENIALRFSNNNQFDSIDYEKDRFLFFYSGYSYNLDVGLGNDLKNSARFDSSFIHHTDMQLHIFKNKNNLNEYIKNIVLENNYAYPLSFVSQIRVFSIVKALEFLKSKNENKNFKGIKIITITDDAEQNDQWMTDYRNLKRWAPGKLEEIKSTITKYVYNQLNGMGKGSLEEIFSDEDVIPHIWVYNYSTFQSQPTCDSLKLFSLKANDGKKVVLTPLSDFYGYDSICFYSVDSIKINNSVFVINQRFNQEWYDSISYENDLKYNDITLYGSIQILYIDSIYGQHYKKVFFVQQARLPSELLIVTLNKALIVAIVLLTIFLIYWLLLLPNKKLFVIYSNQGEKYVFKRGYKHQWKLGEIPVLSCVAQQNKVSVICKKHGNIKLKKYAVISDSINGFLICSRHKIFNNAIATEIDIEAFYSTRTLEYPELLRHIYQKTLFCKCRNFIRNCPDKYKWLRYIVKYYIRIANYFIQKYYYSIPVTTVGEVRLVCPLLKNRTFIIEIDKEVRTTIKTINQKFNIECLNQYYAGSSRKNCNVIICCGMDAAANLIYWNVFITNYEKNTHRSLKYIYNIYQYQQDLSENTKKQIDINFDLLKRVVKREIKSSHGILVYKMDGVPEVSNIHNFEITETSCSGFIYLTEDTEIKKTQLLYSPFKNGLQQELKINLQKTENAHLYLAFVPPTKFIQGDKTLYKKLSDTLVTITNNSSEKLTIGPKKQIIFNQLNIEI